MKTFFFASADPVIFDVVEARENGSGIIRIPILGVTELDVSKTSGGGKGKIIVTKAVLRQFVANFDNARPTPIGFEEHRVFGDRSGASPGFVLDLELIGSTLWASVDLIAPAFFEVMEGMWRGFSIEGANSPTFATGPVDGWILVGGIFTNRPAADVHFIPPALAASATECAVLQLSLKPGNSARKRSRQMSDKDPDQAVELATAKAEVVQLSTKVKELIDAQEIRGSKIADLEREITELHTSDTSRAEEGLTLKSKIQRLEASTKEYKDSDARLTRQLKEAREKSSTLEEVQLGARVTAMVAKAINNGLPRKLFDGYIDDPAKWFREKFGNAEIASLESFIDGLGEIPGLTKLTSKPTDPTPTSIDTKMDPDIQSKLIAQGLDPELGMIENVVQLNALLAKRKLAAGGGV